MENKFSFILHGQYHVYWWPGDTSSHGINSAACGILWSMHWSYHSLVLTQQTHDTIITSWSHWNDTLMWFQCNGVIIIASCVCWEAIDMCSCDDISCLSTLTWDRFQCLPCLDSFISKAEGLMMGTLKHDKHLDLLPHCHIIFKYCCVSHVHLRPKWYNVSWHCYMSLVHQFFVHYLFLWFIELQWFLCHFDLIFQTKIPSCI